MDMLGVIMFSCTLGFVLASMEPDKSEKILQIVDSFNIAIQKMVNLGINFYTFIFYFLTSSSDMDIAHRSIIISELLYGNLRKFLGSFSWDGSIACWSNYWCDCPWLSSFTFDLFQVFIYFIIYLINQYKLVWQSAIRTRLYIRAIR